MKKHVAWNWNFLIHSTWKKKACIIAINQTQNISFQEICHGWIYCPYPKYSLATHSEIDNSFLAKKNYLARSKFFCTTMSIVKKSHLRAQSFTSLKAGLLQDIKRGFVLSRRLIMEHFLQGSSQQTDYYIGGKKKTSPPPFLSTWFVNTPKGIETSLQVTKQRKSVKKKK